MQFPASVPVRSLPGSDAALARAAQQTRGYHYAAWSPDVLVDVQISKLAGALPALDFVFGVGGRRRLPLHVIVFFLGRLGWVEDGSLAVDLTSGLSAATLVCSRRGPTAMAGWTGHRRVRRASSARAHVSSRARDGRAARGAQGHRRLVRDVRVPRRFRGRSKLGRFVIFAYDGQIARTCGRWRGRFISGGGRRRAALTAPLRAAPRWRSWRRLSRAAASAAV